MLTRHRLRFLVASLVVALVLGAATYVAAANKTEGQPDSLFKYLAIFTDAMGLVRQAYVEEPSLDQLMAGAYEGAIDALDPFSIYVPADQVRRFLQVRANGHPDSGLYLLRERGWVYVAGVADGSPAARAGLERGDLVSRVAGESTRDLGVWELEERIARADGAVELEVLRLGEPKPITLTPGAYDLAPVAVSRQGETTVLRIGRFEKGTVGAVDEALAGLARTRADRLLVDLRGVAGGSEEIAYRVADLFVDGPLGTLARRGEVQERYDDERPAPWRGRLVVMIDRGTLGAGEVLATVLDEGAEAALVGEETFGHAGRRDLVSLSSGGLLQLTDAFYTGPGGSAIDSGLEPDVEVEERTRLLRERDLSFQDLILHRALETLDEEAAEEEAAAAA